jgi:hypothetical protein
MKGIGNTGNPLPFELRQIEYLYQFSFLKTKQCLLPRTKAGQEEDDLSSSYCQALLPARGAQAGQALLFPLARSRWSLKFTESPE